MKADARTVGGWIVAMALAGLLISCDKLGVGPPAQAPVGSEIDDAVTTAKVKAALLNEETLKGQEYHVDTHKGRVQLTGALDDQHQIDRALDLARGVPGVSGVDSKLRLKH